MSKKEAPIYNCVITSGLLPIRNLEESQRAALLIERLHNFFDAYGCEVSRAESKKGPFFDTYGHEISRAESKKGPFFKKNERYTRTYHLAGTTAVMDTRLNFGISSSVATSTQITLFSDKMLKLAGLTALILATDNFLLLDEHSNNQPSRQKLQ